MKRWSTYILLGAIFVATSAILYITHYLIFRDVHHIFIYLLGDLAFLPLDVFLVVIVIERILNSREKRTVQQKLNMVIGAYFSEVGNDCLRNFLPALDNRVEIINHLKITSKCTHKDFVQAQLFTQTTPYRADVARLDLVETRSFLVSRRVFLLRLLENPNILENERFTDLLWATFHLTEELESRTNFKDLPPGDLKHLSIDSDRMYRHLLGEWVSYVEHLKNKYPYLYSLVLRVHPFQEHPSATVTSGDTGTTT